MRYGVVLAATAALALDPAAAASEAPMPAAAAATAGAVVFTAGQPPSKEFMVGTWGEGDKCEMPINFEADGTIKDGPFEKWSLDNGELSMEGAPQKLELKVIDANTMESSMEGGSPRQLKRC
jgi:hypothetical protein